MATICANLSQVAFILVFNPNYSVYATSGVLAPLWPNPIPAFKFLSFWTIWHVYSNWYFLSSSCTQCVSLAVGGLNLEATCN